MKTTYKPFAVGWRCLIDLLRQSVRDWAPDGNRRLLLKPLIPIPLSIAHDDTSPKWIWCSFPIDLVSDQLRNWAVKQFRVEM